MAHFGESFGRRAAHALGRRIGRHEIGICGFDIEKFLFQGVEGFVRNLLPVENMIEIPVMVDGRFEMQGAFPRFGLVHGMSVIKKETAVDRAHRARDRRAAFFTDELDLANSFGQRGGEMVGTMAEGQSLHGRFLHKR